MTATLVEDCLQAGTETMTQPRFTDQLDLAAVPTAVSCAQMFVEAVLIKWGAGSLFDQARGVVTDLVATAVESTGVTETDIRWWEIEYLNLIKVRILGFDASIVIEVWDSDTEPPISKASSRDVHRWNYFHPRTGGKVVWCEMELPQRSNAPNYTREPPIPLPRRKRRPQPGPSHPVATERNPELLRRVIEGLRKLDDHSPGGDDMGY
jgi:hypothetical protein